MFQVQLKLPEISMSTDTWITLIEQFLMLILIIGRWMLPKGDLTRDQLSQLLLVYIGKFASYFSHHTSNIFYLSKVWRPRELVSTAGAPTQNLGEPSFQRCEERIDFYL